MLLYGAITRLVANKGGKITWLTKDMVMYHLKKLNNNNNTDLVVGGLNSTVLLDYSPANQIETSSMLTFATRNSTTASTLTTVTFNSDEKSSVRNNYLTDRPDQHETEQTQLSGEKGGGTSTNENSAAIETTQLPPAPGANGCPKHSTMAFSRDYQQRIK